MGDLEHYVALAERMMFNGMNSEQLLKVATYKEGKSFRDVIRAVEGSGPASMFGTGALLEIVAIDLKQILEINTKESLGEYECRLARL